MISNRPEWSENDAARPVIRDKVRRAHEQLRELELDIRRWHDRQPYSLIGDLNPEATEWIGYLRLNEPIPIRWSVILGDVVHNLRSALDQCVYQLALDNTGKDRLRGTGFPIYVERSDYATTGATQIKHVGPRPRAFIESIQPFANTQPRQHPLTVIHQLSNQDKHRLGQLFGVRIDDPELAVLNATGTYEITVEEGVILQDGAVMAKVALGSPSPKVDVQGYSGLNVAFDNPAHPGREDDAYTDTLWGIYDYVTGVVGFLLGWAGCQETAFFGDSAP